MSLSRRDSEATETEIELRVTQGTNANDLFEYVAMFLGRITGTLDFSLGLFESFDLSSNSVTADMFARIQPIDVLVDPNQPVSENRTRIAAARYRTSVLGHFAADLCVRYPSVSRAQTNPSITVCISQDKSRVIIRFAQSEMDASWIHWLPRLSDFIDRCVAEPNRALRDIELLSPQELASLDEHNRTARDYDRSDTIDRAFFDQVNRTPDALAIVSETSQSTYSQLATRVHQLVDVLTLRGVKSGDRVGIATSRSCDMVAGVLAVLRVGAAYVPSDLEFPARRIELMIHDADLNCILIDSNTESRIRPCDIPQINTELVETVSATNKLHHNVSADDLAYVIYTSGSTGVPKGVMVSHRNAMNFFAGMDDVIPHDPPGTWLAMTSLSFDISVLERLWTLCRGFKVVLHDTPSRIASTQRHRAASEQINFGLFYFSSSDSVVETPYRLLRDGSRFADANGFSSVWTPERHFHDFGGP